MTRVRPWAIIGALVLLGACGIGGSSSSKSRPTTTTTTVPPTTAKPSPTLAVEPATGKVGTSFALTLTGAVPGEVVTFHIRFPNNRLRDGQGHTVAPDGTVKATYAATAGNPDGEYQITASGSQGTQASSVFTLGQATVVPSTATTLPRVTSTTHRP